MKDKHTSLGSSNPSSSVKNINKDRKVKSVRMTAEVSPPIDTAPIRRALLVNAKLSLKKVDVVKKNKKDDREVMLNNIKGFKAKLRPTSERISKETAGAIGSPRKSIVSSDSDLLGMIKNTMTARRDKMIGNTTGEIITGFSTSNAKMNDVSALILCVWLKLPGLSVCVCVQPFQIDSLFSLLFLFRCFNVQLSCLVKVGSRKRVIVMTTNLIR